MTAAPLLRRLSTASVAAIAVTSFLTPAASARPVAEASATLVLRSPDLQATAALAGTSGISRAERLRRARALLPTSETASSARHDAAALGLHVTASTPWSMTVRGSAGAVAALAASGTRRAGSVTTSPGLVPAAASVISGRSTVRLRPLVRDLSGSDFRAAYNASSAAPTSATAPTIATIQLAAWNSSDLTTYASDNGLPAPAAGTFTAVTVGDGPGTKLDSSSVEVALDQEAIYSVDPYAHQRAYFASIADAAGYVLALYQVAADALTDPNLVALSTSWGGCESGSDPAFQTFLTQMHAALTQVLAAGVTTFAASGDDGSYDCASQTGSTAPAVDYPASDPLVVAVGGTQLDPTGPTEVAWSYPGPDPASKVGSGGGQSTEFVQPAYQAAVAPGQSSREVPDIAADASDQSPFVVDFNHHRGEVYGTSLAAPISAALLTAELGSRGRAGGGVGDIHQILYAAPATTFRDITVGTNGSYPAGAGYDMVTGLGAPNWHALVDQIIAAPTVTVPPTSNSRTVAVSAVPQPGQTVIAWASGSGTPPVCSSADGKSATPPAVTLPKDGAQSIWVQGYLSQHRCITGLATTTVDTTGPVLAFAAKTSPGAKAFTFSWTAHDALSAVGTTAAHLLRNGKRIWTGATVAGAAGALVHSRQPGSVYQLVVTATDALGNASTSSTSYSVPYDDKSLTFSKGWRRVTSKAALGGKIVTSATKGATAHLKAYGSTYSLLTTTGPTSGVVEVFVNGKHQRDLSLYAKKSAPQHLVKLASFGSAAARTITLVVKGAKGAGSKGVVVNIDGVLAT